MTCLFLGVLNAHANNITITNVTLYDLNAGQNYIYVQFDLSWENSWRTSTMESNWDAAWVFAMYRPEASSEWRRCTLSTNDTQHVVPASAIVKTGATGTNGMGAFIYRAANGTGNVSYTEVQLRWNYGAAGIQENDNVEMAVFGVEMVYVPEGSFYLGDGTSTDINGHFEEGNFGSPFHVTNESYSITMGGSGSGSLGNNNAAGMQTADDFNDAATQTLPSAFPKGYAAFYCMKTEISQGQYADFLSMLTVAQGATRYPSASGRYTITGPSTNCSASTPDRACNKLSWMDGAAYADWAGLRPLSELEFEKACRGTQAAVDTEYAWGTANIHGNAYTLSNDGQTNALVTNPGSGIGNASYSTTDGSINGPLRCGIFSGSTNGPTREEAGGTYYGIMEMSGNLWERAITVGNVRGRLFTGSHGDGILTSDGYANNGDWPQQSGGKVGGANGAGFRGGNYNFSTLTLRVSNRSWALYSNTENGSTYGWRAARTAP